MPDWRASNAPSYRVMVQTPKGDYYEHFASFDKFRAAQIAADLRANGYSVKVVQRARSR